MSSRDRLPLFPSRANHVFLKQRLASAAKGLNLLKRKRDALEIKLRELNIAVRKAKMELVLVMRTAMFSIAKAKYLCTDFKPAAVMSVERADVFMHIETSKVVGVQLPTFKMVMRSNATSFPLIGLAHGGCQIEAIRNDFQNALTVLISLASCEYSSKVLGEVLNQTNKRVNGLEFVVIPKISNTINYIRDELDEYERESFYRLKKSQAKQRVLKDHFAEIIKQRALDRGLRMSMIASAVNETEKPEEDTEEGTEEGIAEGTGGAELENRNQSVNYRQSDEDEENADTNT